MLQLMQALTLSQMYSQNFCYFSCSEQFWKEIGRVVDRCLDAVSATNEDKKRTYMKSKILLRIADTGKCLFKLEANLAHDIAED